MNSISGEKYYQKKYKFLIDRSVVLLNAVSKTQVTGVL